MVGNVFRSFVFKIVFQIMQHQCNPPMNVRDCSFALKIQSMPYYHGDQAAQIKGILPLLLSKMLRESISHKMAVKINEEIPQFSDHLTKQLTVSRLNEQVGPPEFFFPHRNYFQRSNGPRNILLIPY